MPLQRLFAGPAAGHHTAGALPTPAVPAPALLPATDTVTWDDSGPVVQRAPEGESAAPAAVAAPAGASAPAAATTGKPGGPDLDELARRLYGPMSALLRAELWLDRERSGRSLAR